MKNFKLDSSETSKCAYLSEIQEYLRNKGYIVIAIPNFLGNYWDGISDLKWCWHVIYIDEETIHDMYDLRVDESEFKFETYEEALEEGINEAFKIYK